MSSHLVVNAAPNDEASRQFETVGLSDTHIAQLCGNIEDIGFWRYDLDTGLAYWSEGVFRLHGRKFKKGPISLKAAIGDFHPEDRELVSKCVSEAIEKQTGRTPELSTTGGTSDARFITNYCPVLEFGLVGKTIHATDENVEVEDLEKLADIYGEILERYFA